MARTAAGATQITCATVERTAGRSDSEGTYIVRLSPVRQRELGVKPGAYVKVSYESVSVLACLGVQDIRDDTICMDQTLRTALGLEKIMQGQGKTELVYRPDQNGDLSAPIVVQRSSFRGRHWLARLIKQQYLICIVHHSLAEDMEKPLVRLSHDALEVIGIKSGDKVWVISEKGRKSVRCLALNRDDSLPLPTMAKYFGHIRPCPEAVYDEMVLPWITLDSDTRAELGVEPWQPIVVGRALGQVITPEAVTVGLGMVAGALVVPQNAPYWVPMVFVIIGAVCASILSVIKIRSKS